ncbi:MAG: phosphatase PAP2 family protein [Bdellovibrio sp.]|nr:phosphatase PAP2 family protein [Bdellovibrio sp.]
MRNTRVKMVALIFVSLFTILTAGCKTHPTAAQTEKDSLYIAQNLYVELKSQIPDFPTKGSDVQKSDEKELHQAQKTRTKADCARAATEVIITLQSFYAKPYGDLTAQQVEILNPFFNRVREAGGPYIGQIKQGYTRVRPYEYIQGLTPCIEKERSFAYPSGHATLASLYSLVLIDLFPENKAAIEKRAEQIAQDRVLGGVHHPSDIKAGKKLGSLLHAEMLKSAGYMADLQKYQTLVKH